MLDSKVLAPTIKDLDLTVQTIPGVQALSAIARPSLLAVHKSEIVEVIKDAGLRTHDHSPKSYDSHVLRQCVKWANRSISASGDMITAEWPRSSPTVARCSQSVFGHHWKSASLGATLAPITEHWQAAWTATGSATAPLHATSIGRGTHG
jgi:hypothetical protein